MDTGLGVVRLDRIEQAVLRALWPRAGEGRAAALGLLGEAHTHHGGPALAAALHRLHNQGLLFASDEAAERAFLGRLEQGTPSVPFLDHIELTNRCPFRCRFCVRGRTGELTRPPGRMDLRLFEALLDQAHPSQARYRGVELNHMGESLLHPDLPAFVAACTRRGLGAELSCNPTLLTPALARRLLDAGVRRLVLSVDAMDAETLVAIRGPAAKHAKAEAHLDSLLEEVAAHPRPPTVLVQMLDLQANRHQREAFLRRWGSTGLPTVQVYVKPLDGADPDALPSAPPPRPLRALCTFPWRSVVVLWDGRVVPCCRDAHGAEVLGDLRQASLAEIWAAPAALALRELLASGSRPPAGHLCAGCPWSREEYGAALPERHPDTAQLDPLRW